MTSNQIQNPEEVVVETITMDGQDVMGIFLRVDIFENMFNPSYFHILTFYLHTLQYVL